VVLLFYPNFASINSLRNTERANMLGIVLIILLLWQVYKAANGNGRSGVFWAAAAFFGSIILQVMIGLAFLLVLEMGAALWGWPRDMYETLNWPITLITLVINVLAIWLLINYLSRVPETDYFAPPPPPPTDFN